MQRASCYFAELAWFRLELTRLFLVLCSGVRSIKKSRYKGRTTLGQRAGESGTPAHLPLRTVSVIVSLPPTLGYRTQKAVTCEKKAAEIFVDQTAFECVWAKANWCPPLATGPMVAGRGVSPSQRAAAHAAKQRAKDSRKAATPGPGSYDAKAQNSARSYSGAFKSNTRRLEVEDQHTGDPGAYNPAASGNLASAATNSFGRSNKTGSGAFGASSAREMKLDIMGEDTPGPGSYSSKKDLSESTSMPSSAFRSSSAQRMKSTHSATPGAGAYNPNMRASDSIRDTSAF